MGPLYRVLDSKAKREATLGGGLKRLKPINLGFVVEVWIVNTIQIGWNPWTQVLGRIIISQHIRDISMIIYIFKKIM
jgi:hypothetical protein